MNRTPLPELVRTLRTLGDYGTRLDPAAATPEQLAIVRDTVETARRLVAAAAGPAAGHGCARHRGGPTDPTNGLCLLCGTRRRPAAPAAAATADLGDIARDVTELGETEAERRHGARAVARALAAIGRGTHKYPISARPQRRDHNEEEPVR